MKSIIVVFMLLCAFIMPVTALTQTEYNYSFYAENPVESNFISDWISSLSLLSIATTTNCGVLGFTELVKCEDEIIGTDLYTLSWGWTESSGQSGQYPYIPQAPWEYDTRYIDVLGLHGSHGGCFNCIMTMVHLRTKVKTLTCGDGTVYNTCSLQQKSFYCSEGTLIQKASQCGCPTGQALYGDTCIAVTTPTPTTTIINPPPSEPPALSISNIISQILDWIKGFLGLASISGSETINVGTGQQTYSISLTSPEAPDSIYTDKTYSELYGTWFVIDSNQNIITKKSGWTKLSDTVYADSVLVTFTNAGAYSVVGVIVKTPYTYETSWIKGTETIVAKEQIKVSVNVPQPTGSQPSIDISTIISQILNWIKSLFGM